MPYPAKTSAAQIRALALAQVERDGAAALSLRTVAADIGVAPNALYRYYPDRDALLAAVAADGTYALLAALTHAVGARRGLPALRALANAYLEFARARPALYALVMVPHAAPADGEAAHVALWAYATTVAAGAVGEARAATTAVSLWAYLHGVAGLEHAGVVGDQKPRAGLRVGLAALLTGLTAPETPAVRDARPASRRRR